MTPRAHTTGSTWDTILLQVSAGGLAGVGTGSGATFELTLYDSSTNQPMRGLS